MRSRSRQLAVLSVTFLVLSTLLLAQSATTSVRGTITDAKGAVVAGATVTLSSAATGFSRSTKTDGQGTYQFLEVPPATYVMTATAEGFSTTRRENVVLQVSSPATLNLPLEVRGGTVVVDVTGEAPAVNTTDATLGNNFGARQLIDLPSEGRDPVSILSLQPGVTYIGNKVDQNDDSRGGAINGARSDQTNVTLDGLDDNDQLEGYAFQGAMRATLDSLQEFRVTTSNYDAASGRSSGAQVNLVTKSGTNSFHGSLYEYNRPTFDVANDYFNKSSQILQGNPNRPQHILRNTFGGTFGGPLKKDRLFYFMAYEGQRTADQMQVTRIVPTQSLRDGFLRYLCDPNNGTTGTPDPNCVTGSTVGQPNINGVIVDPGGAAFPGYNVVTLTPGQITGLDQGQGTGANCVANGTCPPTPGNPSGPGPNGLLTNISGANPNALYMSYPLPNCAACGNAANGSGDLLNSEGYTFPGNNPTRLNTYIFKLDYKISADGNHSLFIRGNLQNDNTKDPPQFPGQPPNDVVTNNSKGIAAGYTWIIRNNLINNLRYAFIRQGLGQSGINSQDYVQIRFLDDTQALSPSDTPTIYTSVPVNNFIDDISWTKGRHTLQFGTNWRIIHNNRQSNAQNISSGLANLYWMNPSYISGNGVSLDPDTQDFTNSGPLPDVDSGFQGSYDFAAVQSTGLVSQVYTVANQDKNAVAIPNGDLVTRHFRNFEGEMYVQDKWNVTPDLTVTYGLRYSLLQPPYESSGNQVAPTVDMHQWFTSRWQQMYQGNTVQPDLTFNLSGQANGGKPYWDWNYKNLAPRFAIAYSPHADGGFWRKLLGDPGKSSIRAGYGMYYDHFGEGVVNTFDREGSWGLTTTISNPAGVLTVDDSPRFSGLRNIPQSQVSPAPHGFPYAPSNDPNTYGLAIAWGIDNHLKTPYSHVVDFSLTRELPHNFVVEATYTGRFAHHLLQEIDLSQPLDLVDPASKTDYFAAAQALSKAAYAGTSESSIAPIPYWENLFPQAAGPSGISGYAPGIPANPTATQNMYDLYYSDLGNETLALEIADAFCFPACAGTGSNTLGGFVLPTGTPFAYYQDQFSSLYGWQTRGNSNYNGLQLTLRHVMAAGLQFDFNYTFSKSIDVGSNAERVNGFESSGLAFNSQVINAFSPDLWRAPSDFDTTHQINANWVWDLPYGRGRHFGAGSSSIVNGIFGGWGLNGLVRWTSGFPFSVEAGSGYSTDFELEGSSILTGPKPKTGVYMVNGSPAVFQNPQSLSCECVAGSATSPNTFRATLPGEAGQRNNFRGPGFFGLDPGLSKVWNLSEGKTLRFAWEVFNATNSVRFDAAGSLIGESLFNITGFGLYNTELTNARVMQYSLRFAF
ncbi:MAG: carboxypeptidase-like regulatory domain-containing protein [Candidatus Sulfotelmatobacter sp.]